VCRSTSLVSNVFTVAPTTRAMIVNQLMLESADAKLPCDGAVDADDKSI